jgi:hypothetical protein
MSKFLIIIFYKIDKVYMYTISHFIHNLYKKVHYDKIVSFYTRLVIDNNIRIVFIYFRVRDFQFKYVYLSK